MMVEKRTKTEQRLFDKTFKESSGKRLRGKYGDAEDAVKAYRNRQKLNEQVIDKVKRYKNPDNK